MPDERRVQELLKAWDVQAALSEVAAADAAWREAARRFAEAEGERAGPAPQLVKLDQAAAHVHRRKDAIRKLPGRPPPKVKAARRGQANLYDWNELRPFLEKQYSITLPEKFPH